MIGDDAFDAALSYIASHTRRIEIHTGTPNGKTVSGSLGYATKFRFSAPQPCESGRKITVTNIEDGTVTREGVPAYWSMTDGSRVLASGAITNSQKVVPGIGFRLPPLECELERETD